MEISLLRKLPLPEECRRMVEKFAFEPHPIAVLIKDLKFEYYYGGWWPNLDVFEPPFLIVSRKNDHMDPETWTPTFTGDRYRDQLLFSYINTTGEHIERRTFRGLPRHYDFGFFDSDSDSDSVSDSDSTANK